MRGSDSRSGLPKIMKKTALITLSVFILIGLLVKTIRADEFNFAKAFQDYQYSLQTYENSYSDYSDARDFYLKNKTLTLKEDARKKTLKMLRDRDQLEVVYLTTIRLKIIETKGVSDSDKNTIFGLIDGEVEWYKNHQTNYKDGDPLEDLFNKNKESESRYKTNTLQVAYEALFLISLGEETGIRQDNEIEYSNLKTIINEGVAAGKLDMNPFNRWFSDVDSTIQILKTNEELAKTQIKVIHTQSYSPLSSYNTSIETLTSSLQALSQLNNFLIEIVTSIKNQQ